MFKRRWFYQDEANIGDGSQGSSGGGDSGPAPQASPPPAPASSTPPSNNTPAAQPDSSKAYWPQDWRQKWAGADEKKLNRLSNYASPEAAFDALVAAQNKIRSGEYKQAIPKNASPEEMAQWRKDNGIPDKPEEYGLKVKGEAIPEADKGVIDGFLKVAHGASFTPDQAQKVTDWYYEEVTRQTNERLQKDETDKQAALDSLNAEYGHEFRGNMNRVQGLLGQFPDSVRDQIKSARLPDGTGLFNNPDVIRGFVAMAMELNPASTVVPAGGDPMRGVDDEIASIERTMREKRSEYNHDEKMQARYRTLIEARDKMQARKR